MQEIFNYVQDQLMKQGDHLILTHKPGQYYDGFEDSVSLLVQGNVLNSKKSVDTFCNKLKIGKSYDKDQCLQGLSEMMFWLHAVRMGYKFEIDKRLRDDANTDVDLQIVEDGCTFNIEIKTPVQPPKTGDGKLQVVVSHRSFADKAIQEQEVEAVTKKLADLVVKNSGGKYTGIQRKKIDDNKVIEYLRSGQTKFVDAPKSLNVLVLAVPYQQMNDYWGYLYNPLSGIFTPQVSEMFKDKKGAAIGLDTFDLVDVICLTNMVEGHLRCLEKFDAWDLRNYCNLFCCNPYSRRCQRGGDREAYAKLNDVIPNDTAQFERERDEAIKRDKKNGVPTDPMFIWEYLYKHYQILNASG